jgi:phenylacetate-CoA ligase
MVHRYFDREAETADVDSRQALQHRRLQSLLHEVLNSNPFYHRKLHAAGLRAPDDLASLADLSHLPFTTKQELVDDQGDHPLFGSNLTYPAEKYIRLHQTSGTTGKPLRWLDTPESWAWWQRCWATIYRAAGVGHGDRIFFPFSFGPFIGFWAGWAGSELVGALAISGGAQNSEKRLETLMQLEATVVCCTPSYALHLAEVARQSDIDLPSSRVRAIIVAGEPGGSIPGTRQRIEREWGAKVFDHTGATEVGAHGFTCLAQSGVHLNESEFIAEVVDPQKGHPAEMGELVLTNLGRIGSPVIRYRTGDIVQLDRARCECGRTFVRMAGGIRGRADDMLTVRGVNVFPSAVENIVRRYPEIVEFEAEVNREGALDELELRIEVVYADPVELAARLEQDLRSALGLRLRVTAVPLGQLPRYELKARRFHDRRKEIK